jgi:hypothetical protein
MPVRLQRQKLAEFHTPAASGGRGATPLGLTVTERRLAEVPDATGRLAGEPRPSG